MYDYVALYGGRKDVSTSAMWLIAKHDGVACLVYGVGGTIIIFVVMLYLRGNGSSRGQPSKSWDDGKNFVPNRQLLNKTLAGK